MERTDVIQIPLFGIWHVVWCLNVYAVWDSQCICTAEINYPSYLTAKIMDKIFFKQSKKLIKIFKQIDH